MPSVNMCLAEKCEDAVLFIHRDAASARRLHHTIVLTLHGSRPIARRHKDLLGRENLSFVYDFKEKKHVVWVQ